jgi:predicted TIM-barrel fold metal-dependent hydrolase
MKKEAKMATLRVIDSDGHVQERDADIRPHLEEPYCKRRGSLLPGDEWDSSMYGTLGLRVSDVAMRLRDMDTETIDTSVLFPTSAFHMSRLTEKDYAAAYCRAYNNWIAEHCKASPRIKGAALVPFQNVAAAVEEVNRAVTKLGLAGIAIASFGMKEHLGKPEFWPIYEEIQRLNVPLLVHNSRQGPAGEIRYDTFLFKHCSPPRSLRIRTLS